MPQRIPKALLAVLPALLAASLAILAVTAGANRPSQDTLSPKRPSVGWNGKTFSAGQIGIDAAERFTVNVGLPASHWKDHVGGAEFLIAWSNPKADFALKVVDATGKVVGSSDLNKGTSERVLVKGATGAYRAVVVPKDARGESYKGGVMLQSRAIADDRGGAPTEPLYDVPCANGKAGPFPCSNVDLKAFLPIEAIGGDRTLNIPETGQIVDYANPADRLNDIWGWTDPVTRREYALVGKSDGVAFVDITNATSPTYLGDLPTHNPIETIYKIWRDVKVYKDHMFVVSEEDHGMQVFDLTRLRGVTEPQEWTEDAHYAEISNTHNIAINEQSGFAYLIGTNTCEGGPHMVDIRSPKAPRFAGCNEQDGYTHDTQCVNYSGPDRRYRGREICFNSNEDTLTIVDVTSKSRPVQLSRVSYDGAQYTHQGWLTKDRRHFLVNDELDEQTDGVPTTTRSFDVTRLDNPRLVESYKAKVGSIDHNLYTRGDTVFEANYRSGLRVLDGSRVGRGGLREVGFFDVYPADDEPEFNGAWSNYPYFPSGNVVVSGIEQGLFVVRPTATR
jgi:choice-of-anchor B domain-containing protein